MLGVYPLFPVPIAKVQYPQRNEFKDKVLNFIKENKELEVDGITSPELKHFFNSSELEKGFFDYIQDEDFKNFLQGSAYDFVKGVMGYELEDDLIITDCWINTCYKNGFQRFHSHANSFVSATYYVNYIPSIHSALTFLNPFFNLHVEPFFELNKGEITLFNQKEVECDFIEEGDLVLWSSHLDHGYDINIGNGRVSISMNFVPSKFKSGPYTFTIQK
jgi:Putative 2OG-Fe(II) oxygenase